MAVLGSQARLAGLGLARSTRAPPLKWPPGGPNHRRAAAARVVPSWTRYTDGTGRAGARAHGGKRLQRIRRVTPLHSRVAASPEAGRKQGGSSGNRLPEGVFRADRAVCLTRVETPVDAFDRITSDPSGMNGQPCIRNPRLTVRRVLEALATHPDREGLRREHPDLEDEGLRRALAYAAVLEDRLVDLPRTA